MLPKARRSCGSIASPPPSALLSAPPLLLPTTHSLISISLFFFLFLLINTSFCLSPSDEAIRDENLPPHPRSPPERPPPPLHSSLSRSGAAFSSSSSSGVSASFGSAVNSLPPKNTSKNGSGGAVGRRKAKRQAYQVYLGGEVGVSVDHQGSADSGPWGEWTRERECTRSCGGGVQTERRLCAEGSVPCSGSSIRYISCNVEACPPGTKDFRREQCAKHNDDPLDGRYHKWIPYAGKNKCELTCRPEDANFYYKFAEQVEDGTRCDLYSDDICVNGFCLPVGCDGKLGSDAKKDKCGVCKGDGSGCKTVEGLFDERGLSLGYHDIISIPAGATAIQIEEIRPTSNVFAIKNATGAWLLNGNFQIQVLTKNLLVGGAAFKYEKGDGGTEKLSSNGPLNESLTISLLIQRASQKSSAVKYEYSVPLEKDVKFLWKPGEWTSCSVTCGKGIQSRTLFCVDLANNVRVDDSICVEQNATKPEFEKVCKTVDCEPEYFIGNWEPCSATCGDKGLQFRVLYCHRLFADGRRMTVSDGNCTERGIERPEARRPCARWACPEWQAGPWSACSSQCGDAKQFRSVTCRSAKEDEQGKLLPADACPKNGAMKPQAERDCNLGPCEGLHFKTTEWELCKRCNDTEEKRSVTCQDRNGREYPLEKCLEIGAKGSDGKKLTKIPEDTRPCESVAPCFYEWHFSQWSKCSTECGHGHRNRTVFCAINELGQTKRVDESLCVGEKPDAREECLTEEKCTGTFFTGPWSECSASCGGGAQSRAVVCLNYDRKPVPEWCDEKERPSEQQECNTKPCPVCSESEFGCCADNVTFASGPFQESCSNCSVSEFGCCSDNITEKQGPKGQGCPDWVEPPKTRAGDTAAPADGKGVKMGGEEEEEEGSGEEPIEESATTAGGELCELVSQETGEKLQILCTTISPTVAEAVAQAILKSAGDEGTAEEATNETTTKHCSKTEFGCCPDWYTPAEGPLLAGCSQFVLGTCNETKFGCCEDNVTLARGKDFAGCGEPTCAASLYGCCKDRRTIAFGPNYGGCERSNFPCELSEFGCCADGVTAAQGKNGSGCGASCLLTRYGCCPNGVTQALGPNNEGCGCEFSQYGCCADGKSSAKGPGFYACPESCAQSKFGCCPDGKTESRGPNKEGCPCQYTRWGCCDDGQTTALGPLSEGCDDCRYAKYGCCPDGNAKATGPDFTGCPTTTPAPYIIGGTVSPTTIVASCSLPKDQGQVCAPGYKLIWYYDTNEGRCSQFWYGGCGGNENRFATKEQCEQICVDPPGIGRCYLPKMEGPTACTNPKARYFYDYVTKQCSAFWHRGCLGNSNNFDSWEECQQFCASADASQVQGNIVHYRGPQQPVSPLQPQQQPQQQQQISPPQQERAPPPAQPQQYPQQPQPQQQQYPPYQPYQPPVAAILPIPTEQIHRLKAPPSPQPQKKPEISPFEEDDACRLFVDSGSCHNYQDNWYYDQFSGQCLAFLYGGCGGNKNRFGSEGECRRKCAHLTKPGFLGQKQHSQQFNAPRPVETQRAPTASQKAFLKISEVCNLRAEVGKCHGHFESWYYEVATGQCERFTYSGCGGNANRFMSVEDCQARCLRRRDSPPSSAPSAAVSAFQAQSQEAPPPSQTFSQNFPPPPPSPPSSPPPVAAGSVAFNSLERARQASICEAPKETGTCKQFATKWFYNKLDGTCNRFHYGGCEGNANRFDTEQECRNTCGEYRDACQLPKVIGPCAGKTDRFYFDFHNKQCTQFQYSGCLGNNNNFRSIEDCRARCFYSGA